MKINIIPTDRGRFFSKVKIPTRHDSCWEWIAGKSHLDGRGRFWIDGDTRSAPSISYIFHFGDIPDGMFVCHHCDNPSCVNPAHLFLGTHSDNMRDMVRKGRRIYTGENAPASKLSNKEVEFIREQVKSKQHKQIEMARMFHVHQTTISKIVQRHTFR